jgi:hypothetical protein
LSSINFSTASSICPELCPGCGVPVIVADGNPLNRVSRLGALRISVVTSAETGIMAPAALRTWKRPTSSGRWRNRCSASACTRYGRP